MNDEITIVTIMAKIETLGTFLNGNVFLKMNVNMARL